MKFLVGTDAFWPAWFALAVADGRIRTESGGARKPIKAAFVQTEHGTIAARDGDTIVVDEAGAFSVVAGNKWRFHI